MLASSWGCPTVDSISVIVKKKMKKKKIRLTVLCDGRSCRPRVSISRMRDVLGSTARVTWARMYFHGYSQPICDLTPVAGDGVLMQLNGDAAYSSEWDEWMNGSHTERRAHCLPPGRLSSAAYQLSTLQRGGGGLGGGLGRSVTRFPVFGSLQQWSRPSEVWWRTAATAVDDDDDGEIHWCECTWRSGCPIISQISFSQHYVIPCRLLSLVQGVPDTDEPWPGARTTSIQAAVR